MNFINKYDHLNKDHILRTNLITILQFYINQDVNILIQMSKIQIIVTAIQYANI